MGGGERGERCADRAEPGGLECSCRLVSRALALGLDEIRAHGAGTMRLRGRAGVAVGALWRERLGEARVAGRGARGSSG